jgi:hypothetical protein
LISNYVLLQHVDLNHNILVMGIILGVLGIAHLLKQISADATVSPTAGATA